MYFFPQGGKDMNLLDYIVEESNCSFISDLKRTDEWKLIVAALKENDNIENLFSIDDWNHCIDYLSRKDNPAHFNTAKEAIAYLLEK